jgi:dTDP-D-glucose 4,6-dehydratase
LLNILGKSKELIEFVGGRPGYDRRYALEIGMLSGELDWQPAGNLEDDLHRTVQ